MGCCWFYIVDVLIWGDQAVIRRMKVNRSKNGICRMTIQGGTWQRLPLSLRSSMSNTGTLTKSSKLYPYLHLGNFFEFQHFDFAQEWSLL